MFSASTPAPTSFSTAWTDDLALARCRSGRRRMRLAQLRHPLGPVLRPFVEPRLQIAEDVAPGPIEISERLVPLAALAPAGVMQRHAGRVRIDRREADDDEGALRPRLGQRRRC